MEEDIVQVGGRPTLCLDREAVSWFQLYSGESPVDRPARIALVFPDEAMLKRHRGDRQNDLARTFSKYRTRILLGEGDHLPGHNIMHHAAAEFGDDAVIKRRFPPPPSIDATFEWTPKDRRYRLRVRTETSRGTVSRTTVFDPHKPFGDQVAKAYGRYERTSPAPRTASVLRCGPHVADIVERLEAPAARQLDAWIMKVRGAKLSERSQVSDLLLPITPRRDSLVTLTLSAVANRDEIAATVTYKDGRIIRTNKIGMRGTLPDTVLEALPGKTLADLWAGGRHEDVRIVKRATDLGSIEFEVEWDLVPFPQPGWHEGDRDESRELLGKACRGISFDAGVASFLAGLAPDEVVHLLRSMKLSPEHMVDVSHLDGPFETLVFRDDHVSGGRHRRVSMDTLLAAMPAAERSDCRSERATL